MKRLAIIASGDLGKLIAHHAVNSHEVVGFFDDFVNPNELVAGLPVLGPLQSIVEYHQADRFDELIMGIGYKHFEFRTNLFKELSENINFATLVHPSCYVDPSVRLGKGVCLLPGSVLDQNVVIEDNVLVNVGCTIAHDSLVGANSFLAPSVSIAGFVEVGEQCNIGINTTIIDNVKIAAKIRTGGGTVVISSLDKEGLYVGNPSRFVK